MSRRSTTKAENETNQNNSTHIEEEHYDKTSVIYFRNLNNKHEHTLTQRIEPGTFSSIQFKTR